MSIKDLKAELSSYNISYETFCEEGDFVYGVKIAKKDRWLIPQLSASASTMQKKRLF